jgi:hypothetical protein
MICYLGIKQESKQQRIGYDDFWCGGINNGKDSETY